MLGSKWGCGVPPSHFTLEGPQMTASLQDALKEFLIFRLLFIFKLKHNYDFQIVN